MVDVVLGRNVAEGLFTLSDAERERDGELSTVTATLELEDLRASTKVFRHYATCMDELIAFFDDMAAHWRGWDGSKIYESLEGDLRLDAQHDLSGHVKVMVELKGNILPYNWVATGGVITDPGAQMEGAAANARLLLARFPTQ
jgi:hypothetical protein